MTTTTTTAAARVGLLLGALCAAAGARAEAPSSAPVRLTLGEALERARAGSPRLAQLRALAGAADAAQRGARGARLPQIDLTAGYTRNSDVPELSITLPGQPPRVIFPNIPDTFRTRAGVALPLYTAGRVTAGVAAAAAQNDAALQDVSAGDNDLIFETTGAYWSLVTARESERVLSEALAAYEKHLDDARHRQELGMAARNEVLAVQVERDRAELVRVRAHHAAAVAEADLARLVGLGQGTRIEPADPADPAGAPPPAEADLAALVAEAGAARPELLALRARLTAAEAAVRVERAAALPQASLSAGYDYARPNTRILPLREEWRGTWSISVGLAWTAFDGGRSAAAVAQARAQADALRRQIEDVESRVRVEVTARGLELKSAHAALAVAERALLAARENTRVAADRYREGVGSSTDLLDAETALLRVGLDRTAAAAQVQSARAGLRRAVGR